MTAQNPLFDDMARMMTGALGVAQSASEEMRTMMRTQVERMVAGMDLAGRAEVEALKTLARDALARAEALEARVAELEAGLRSKPARRSSGTSEA
jgi:BMFP domain-containing protein YqiC